MSTPAGDADGFLAALDERTRQDVRRVMRRRTYRRGETMFHEGDPADSLYLVVRGAASVHVTTRRGDRSLLNVVGPGELIGELALLDSSPRSATVTALMPTEALSLHRDDFESLRQRTPQVDRVLVLSLADSVRLLSANVRDLMYTPSGGRLATTLRRLTGVFHADTVPLTQDDLAALAGCTRQTVNELLTRWSDDGVVAVARGRVTVVDAERLGRLER